MAPLLHTIYGQPNAAKAARNMSRIFKEIRLCLATMRQNWRIMKGRVNLFSAIKPNHSIKYNVVEIDSPG